MLVRIPALATVLVLPLLVLVLAGSPAAAATTIPPQKAYYLVASDGGIFSFGGAPFYGSMGGHPLNEPMVGMAATPTGHGYWEVASDGGIFTFGSAQFYGSMGGHPLNEPVVGMAALPTGGGYWEVASDGGIFTFGNAQFYGSMGGHPLNEPIVGMAAMPTGHGYWEVASDGGIFTFGNAGYHGSLGGAPQSRPIVAMAAPSTGGGYWVTDDNGLVSNFGDATFWGSAPQILNAPVVGMAPAVGNGDPGNTAYQSGSYGYDISDWQCTGGLPPAPHQIGIVEVDGSSGGQAQNPCLATEAAWAGGGLGLYTFLTYGTTTQVPDPACAQTATRAACNYGFLSATAAYSQAQAAGIYTLVSWWLDVERGGSPTYWTPTVDANAAVVQGALDGLHSKGINTVGFYFSASAWKNILGSYNPAGPLWVASWWTPTTHTPTPRWTCTNGRSYWAAHGDTWPSGPVDLVQYTDNAGGFDGDYAC